MKLKLASFIAVLPLLLGLVPDLTRGVLQKQVEGVIEGQPGNSEAREALDFWTRSRAYPQAEIPPEKYFQAFSYSKSSFTEAVPYQELSSTWQSIGPLNVGGRMTSVAINPLNPNTVYAGSASGGLWKSTTRGEAGDWQRVATGFPVLGVMAIAIDPVDTSTVYIGTGEVYRYQGSVGGFVTRTTMGSYGMGVLKTTNGGSSWTKSLNWTSDQRRGIEVIRINPLNHKTIFAGTSEG